MPIRELPQKTLGMLWGVFLGLGAPVVALFFRIYHLRAFSFSGIMGELSEHSDFYAYMALLTPLVFALFGSTLGRISDRISAQKKSLETLMVVLESQSMTDDVTGLYNHRHLMEEVDREIERARRHHRGLCGMMIDIDDFKKVNDLYGHLSGDIVLRDVASVINESIRRVDILGRYGGDEFMVILPETGYDAARVVAERIQANVRRRRFKTTRDYIHLTVSLGIMVFEDAANLTPSVFVEKVDETMFKAKGLGKDRVCCHDLAVRI